jgi:DNA-binding beta-propeller fold protein YncE
MAKPEVFLRKWGTPGAGDGQFNGPAGIAVKGDEVFVTELGNNRVQVFDRNGAFLKTLLPRNSVERVNTCFSSGAASLHGAAGVYYHFVDHLGTTRTVCSLLPQTAFQ